LPFLAGPGLDLACYCTEHCSITVLTGLFHALSAQPCSPGPVVYRAFCTSSIRGHRLRELLLVLPPILSCALPARPEPPENCYKEHWKLAGLGPGLVLLCCTLCGSVLDFQSPISSYSQIDPQVQTMPDQTTLAAPQSPKPGLKIVVSERVERQLASLPTSQCMLCPSESGHPGQPAPVWGSSFSLCLPLHNFQWALCNWCCAAGAGAGAVLVLFWCCVDRGAVCCLLLDPHSCSSPSPSPSRLSLVSAFSSFAAGTLPQL
jgi:hypothetical protein